LQPCAARISPEPFSLWPLLARILFAEVIAGMVTPSVI